MTSQTSQLDEIAVVAAPLPILSTDQTKILALIAEGTHDAGIAEKLGLGLEKVKNEEKKLRTALYARSRCHLVAIAYRYGLFKNPDPDRSTTPPPGAQQPPYAFYVLPRKALNKTPRPDRTIAVVAIRPQMLWSIRMGTLIRSTSGTWDNVPTAFTSEWLADHTWTHQRVFDIAQNIVRDQQIVLRERSR